MLRFYQGGININDIREMTINQFIIFSEQMTEIMYMESGQKRPLSGKAADTIAKLMFSKKD